MIMNIKKILLNIITGIFVSVPAINSHDIIIEQAIKEQDFDLLLEKISGKITAKDKEVYQKIAIDALIDKSNNLKKFTMTFKAFGKFMGSMLVTYVSILTSIVGILASSGPHATDREKKMGPYALLIGVPATIYFGYKFGTANEKHGQSLIGNQQREYKHAWAIKELIDTIKVS